MILLTRSRRPASLVLLALASFILVLPIPVQADASFPSYSIGDWWRYRLQSTITTPQGTITAEGTLKLTLVAEESVTVGSSTYAAYRFDVSGSGTYGGAIIGTFTETGATHLRSSDLAEIKTRVVVQAFAGVSITETAESVSTPPHKQYDLPLSLGKTWNVVVTTNTTTTTIIGGGLPQVQSSSTTESRAYSVDRNENTVADAGAFETFRVHYSNATFTSDDYYSAQVGNTVKQVMTGPSGSTTLTLTDYGYWPNRTPFTVSSSGRNFDLLIRTTVTASNPRHDSTSFSFEVSGTDGTTGKANVSIPKQLNNTAIKVLVDSTQVSASVSQNSTHYHVSFAFTLSQHTVMVSFYSPSIWNNPYVIGGIVGAAVAVALATAFILLRRKKAPPMVPTPEQKPMEPPPPQAGPAGEAPQPG